MISLLENQDPETTAHKGRAWRISAKPTESENIQEYQISNPKQDTNRKFDLYLGSRNLPNQKVNDTGCKK